MAATVLAVVVLVLVAAALVMSYQQARAESGTAAPAGARGGVGEPHAGDLPLDVAIPNHLYEPHIGRAHPPVVVGTRDLDPWEASRAVAERPVPHRPLATRFDLPDAVRSRLTDLDDPAALVETLFSVGGLGVEREDDMLCVGDERVIVVDVPVGELLDDHQLSEAYLRFRATGARRGVLVTPGFFDFNDVRRREIADPSFLHAGFDGIQRMADAVAGGLDPLRSVAATLGAEGTG